MKKCFDFTVKREFVNRKRYTKQVLSLKKQLFTTNVKRRLCLDIAHRNKNQYCTETSSSYNVLPSGPVGYYAYTYVFLIIAFPDNDCIQ